MPIVTYRGEANVGEVADKVYSRLTPKQREKAEAELIKANPQLKSVKKLTTGTILRVPDVPELRAKTNRKVENPDDQIANNIVKSLQVFASRMDKTVTQEKEALKEQAGVLKSAKVKRLTESDPVLQALSKDSAVAIGNRSKLMDERKKLVAESVKSAMSDLKKEFL